MHFVVCETEMGVSNNGRPPTAGRSALAPSGSLEPSGMEVGHVRRNRLRVEKGDRAKTFADQYPINRVFKGRFFIDDTSLAREGGFRWVDRQGIPTQVRNR